MLEVSGHGSGSRSCCSAIPRRLLLLVLGIQTVWRLEWFAAGRLTAADQWEPSLRDTELARDRFYECARRDLGVQGGVVPTPPWPPQWIRDLTTTGDTPDE